MMYGRGYAGDFGCFGNGFFNSGWGFFIGIGTLLIVGAVIYLLVKRNNKISSNDNVLEILNLRYAKGELSVEEYLQRKKVLSDSK